jgi:hypothetical protein
MASYLRISPRDDLPSRERVRLATRVKENMYPLQAADFVLANTPKGTCSTFMIGEATFCGDWRPSARCSSTAGDCPPRHASVSSDPQGVLGPREPIAALDAVPGSEIPRGVK